MNKPHTEETKEKIRQKHLGKKLSPEHRSKVIKTLMNESGEKNPHWKGGRTLQGGYIIVRKPNHPNARSNGYYPEHRLVMETKLGRYLNREEVIHHINGDKLDNRPENLVLTTHQKHKQIHWNMPGAREKQSLAIKRIRKLKHWSK